MNQRTIFFLTSPWLCNLAKNLFGKVGILVKEGSISKAHTWDPSNKNGKIISEGWENGIQGILTIDRLDPYWDDAKIDLECMDDPTRSETSKRDAQNRLQEGLTVRFFSQLAALSLSHPIAENVFLVGLGTFFGLKTKFHACFVDKKGPNSKILASHRVFWDGAHWQVINDMSGGSDLAFIMDFEDVKEYAIRLKTAQNASDTFWWKSMFEWFKFLRWYKSWAEKTTIKLRNNNLLSI